MYFKSNNKSGAYSSFGNRYHFPYYEFSKLQQWLEVGQRLQKIYFLYSEIEHLLEKLDLEHGPILQKKYDKTSGYTGGTAKPIKGFVKPEEIKYFCRLIEEVFNRDLPLIIMVNNELRKLIPYQNLMENLKIFGQGNKVLRELVEKYFDYITLDSLRNNLLNFWDEVRKTLDDKTNEIVIPKPTIENREFFTYFLQARDCYCGGNEEIALAIIRKAIEDMLTRLWILHFEKIHDMKNFNQRPKLDNLPGVLKDKKVLDEQESREARVFVKYGNAGIHVKGEIPKKKIDENSKLMINNGITFVNNLTKKYIEMLRQRGYCNIEFTKTGFSMLQGDIQEYIARGSFKKSFKREDIEEFKE